MNRIDRRFAALKDGRAVVERGKPEVRAVPDPQRSAGETDRRVRGNADGADGIAVAVDEFARVHVDRAARDVEHAGRRLTDMCGAPRRLARNPVQAGAGRIS